ncbi:hypothetical protein [Mycobacterium sp.]
MDHDLHLFTDASTGVDAVVYRGRPSGLRLARQRCMRPPRSPRTASWEPIPRAMPPSHPDADGDRRDAPNAPPRPAISVLQQAGQRSVPADRHRGRRRRPHAITSC